MFLNKKGNFFLDATYEGSLLLGFVNSHEILFLLLEGRYFPGTVRY